MRTFPLRDMAAEWATCREVELVQLEQLTLQQRSDPHLLGSLIHSYLDQFPETSGSKRRHLEFLQHQLLAAEDARRITTARLVEHARMRRSEGVSPAMALNELLWIGVVLEAAVMTHGEIMLPDVATKARAICRAQGLIGIGARRDRTPAEQELALLSRYFRSQGNRAKLPMTDLIWFAVHAHLRAADICRLEWGNVEDDCRIIRIPDAHATRQHNGGFRLRRLRLNADAIDIVQSQHRVTARVFPFKARSVCVAFARACDSLAIEDLSFDDLRWYGTSSRDATLSDELASALGEAAPLALRPAPAQVR